MIIEKECEICGVTFTTNRSDRKYCDTCQKDTRHLKKELEFGLKRIALLDEPKPIEETCEYCGKIFITISKLRACHGYLDKENRMHVFCSEKCKYSHIKENATCLNCGKSLADSWFYDPVNGKNAQFCDGNCQGEYKKKNSPPYEPKYCINCGKELPPNHQKFCNMDCMRAAKEKGYQTPKPKLYEYTCKCPICGKIFTGKTRIKVSEDYTKSKCCSKECEDKLTLQHRQQRKKQARERELKKKVQEHKKTQKIKQTMSLCSICKTSYKDCERMQSEFRIIPKGAHYNSQGILTVCPKFKE